MILLFLFSNILVDSDVIVVSFVIWIINLIIPGLFGLFFLAQTSFAKMKGAGYFLAPFLAAMGR